MSGKLDDQGSEPHEKIDVLVIGPCPPPDGGVANFIRYTGTILRDQYGLVMDIRRVGPRPTTPPFMLPLVELGRIVRLAVSPSVKTAQVFHIHSSSFWSFFRSAQYALLARYLGSGKVIFHIHSGEFLDFFSSLPSPFRRWGTWVLDKTDLIIVTSPKWLSMVRTISNTLPATTVFNGFDPEKFHPLNEVDARSGLGLPLDKKILVSVGRLEHVKGYQYLLVALKEVAAVRDDVVTYIIGNGSLRGQLLSQVKDLGLDGKVFFIEQVPHDRVPLWIGACDLFVLPSLMEGNPVVMFESLGCGKPFIGTRVGGIPDVIVNEEYGLLCDPMDPPGLARAIEAGLDKRWDHGAIAKYSENFTWKRISEELLKVYGRIVAER